MPIHISNGFNTPSANNDSGDWGLNLTHRDRTNRSQNAGQTDGTNASPTTEAQRRTESDASALKLTVRTAEGDTVELSIESQTVVESSHTSSSSTTNGSQRTAVQDSQAKGHALQASIKVTGNLSDAEVRDITNLLSSIGSALDSNPTAGTISASAATAAATSSQTPSTLAAYAYSYTHVHEIQQSAAAAYA